MQFPGMLIHGRSRLSTIIALGAVKIASGDTVLAENAFERDAAIHRLGCVISHSFHCSSICALAFGQEVLTLRVEALWNQVVWRIVHPSSRACGSVIRRTVKLGLKIRGEERPLAG